MELTIIVPCWNHGMFLAACLDSLKAQTLAPKDIIVLDDGSTDDTVAICEKAGVASLSDGFRRGTAVRLNQGFEMASTPWVMPMGADDLLPPNFVEAHARALAAHDGGLWPAGLVYSRACYIDSAGQPLLGFEFGQPWQPSTLRFGNYVHGGAMVLREAWENGGMFPEDGSAHEDYQLWRRIEDRGYGFVYVADVLYRYRQHHFGHRNYGTDKARDRDWEGQPVAMEPVPNAVFPSA